MNLSEIESWAYGLVFSRQNDVMCMIGRIHVLEQDNALLRAEVDRRFRNGAKLDTELMKVKAENERLRTRIITLDAALYNSNCTIMDCELCNKPNVVTFAWAKHNVKCPKCT